MIVCGLYIVSDAAEQPIPLKKVHADVNIIDCLASVTLSQTYVNEGSLPVEAIYKFPVYESAAVYAFEADIDGTVVRGVCREREEAAKEYNAAIAAGNRAFLLEEQKADIFQISVGNIPPSKPVIIRISYVHECKTDEANDELRFTIPTTIASQTYGSFAPPKGTNLMPGGTTYDSTVDYRLSLAIDIRMASGPITEVSSATHPIKLSLDGADPKHASAKLALDAVYLDRDFVLVVKSPGLDKPRAVIERDPTSGTKCCMVTFVPKFRSKEAPTEVIFVLDRSGSMGGENIANARTALLLLLKSLPETCKFNIIGFGSSYQLLFPSAVPYNESNLNTAVRHAETVEADLGGTDILEPLEAAVRQPPEKEWQRSIIVLTDGEVYNTDSIFDLASRTSRTQNTRFFTLGVGAAVSHLLVNGLARAGLGSAEFVGPGERMEGKVIKLIKAGVRGFVRDFKVTWLPASVIAQVESTPAIPPSENASSQPPAPAASTSFFDDDMTEDPLPKREVPTAKIPLVQPAPFRAPPLYAGSRYISFAILDGRLADPTSVTISGVGPDGPMEVQIPIGAAGEQGKTILHTMAARKLVQDMEESTSWMHVEGADVGEARVRTEVVRLGKAYGVASKFTSYVAVQILSGLEKAVGKPQRIVVPSRPEPQSPMLSGGLPRPMAAPMVITRSASRPTSSTSRGRGGAYRPAMQMQQSASSFRGVALGSPYPVASAPSFPRFAQAAPPPAPSRRMESGKSAKGGVSKERRARSGPSSSLVDSLSRRSSASHDDESEDVAMMEASAPSPISAGASSEEKLLALVSLQKFDGSFAADIPLFGLCPNVSRDPPAGRTAEEWATALAIAIMEVLLSSLRDEWEMVADKAGRWLEKRMGEAEKRKLVDEAKQKVTV
ncbi:hypothetical protein M427DRAFT_53241 [Gonapodya prolifera JEL478]|uniref:VIT-domain-containing protein n=1 Tax=Gonapodya prolifera (strain JEL478) TaxID=1344416 RepID=A0A139ARD0_GONPJ|nr:hypothetical protein M427DRAFT_53241 [Gonapodya prolifera JEL478]|eukprot:KXS19298.1 hypothetical protein M427DRAFT_53241 [Gonapodya prolifera JEL478]